MASKKQKTDSEMDSKPVKSIIQDSSFLDFLKMKAAKAKLLEDFGQQREPEKCVFCGEEFNPASPGQCSVIHKVEDWNFGGRGMSYTYCGEYRHKGHVLYMMNTGTCTVCGEVVRAQSGDCEWVEDDAISDCYDGPHVSSYPEGYGEDIEEEEEGEEEGEEKEEERG
ncbi:unnamed protein product [Polarella glacialis]|uniref:Uncharacterized protein n=1 Tax=Polarella glacialis TaxID=89957 RepID=A0A813FLX1_POLGL|nr:unnamed protein product [Polarella glacialis]CAE8680776.1 unnamed protein product [Polarella glacialis]|eukprot:CAMPEP_0115108038 /NCGR_PEP_ID=MMETSP0227-20121206/37713_1 /TAXON_ID=89957 /ORGANISM="Polarella glacialis, Strain CCMP 1383" /LENGTH=166 /DNA_ID=CAMNT_0002506151 /DNA_START=1 /DNA_END=501 /DNA_ORIENTATION=-